MKCPLFIDYMTGVIENPKEFTEKLLELRVNSARSLYIKSIYKKSTVFLHTSNGHLENEAQMGKHLQPKALRINEITRCKILPQCLAHSRYSANGS